MTTRQTEDIRISGDRLRLGDGQQHDSGEIVTRARQPDRRRLRHADIHLRRTTSADGDETLPSRLGTGAHWETARNGSGHSRRRLDCELLRQSDRSADRRALAHPISSRTMNSTTMSIIFIDNVNIACTRPIVTSATPRVERRSRSRRPSRRSPIPTTPTWNRRPLFSPTPRPATF